MNKFTKIIAAVLVLVLLVALVPAAFAAEYKAKSGDSVVVKFSFSNIMGIDGTVSVSDPDGIVASSKITEVSELGGSFSDQKLYCFSTDLSVKNKVEVSYLVNLNNKTEGECTVTLTYELTGKSLDDIQTGSVSHTVKIKADETTTKKPEPSESTTKKPEPSESTTKKPTPTESTTKKPTPTESTTKKPTPPVTVVPPVTEPPVTVAPPVTDAPGPGVYVDYEELKKQIATAEGLDEKKYTAESWKKFTEALENAKNALYSKDQTTVDAAAAALADAIKALVPVDYTKLEAAIEKVNTFVEKNEVAGKVKDLMDALLGATDLLNSNDQEAIDAAAAELEKLLAEIEELIKNLTVVETITEKVEVEVEVEPSGDYCNISIHYVWPILFFISLALNLGFIALIVVYLVRRKKNQKDDTPLVDYDISDDAE